MMSLLQTLQQQTLPAKYTELTENEMKRRVLEIKKKLGSKLFLLGHHYQKDEVYEFADAVGDSLQLAQIAAENREAEHIVFCGVHFMAETADILTAENQKSFYPICELAVQWLIWLLFSKQKRHGLSYRIFSEIRLFRLRM